MVYFCCTSMFQVFVILFMMKSEYKTTDKKKVLILLDHVHSLMMIKDNLVNSKLFDEVIVLHTENTSFNEIDEQLDKKVVFSGDITFHLMGREYVGFSIYNKLADSSKIILTCETIMSNIDIKYSINEFYKKDWFQGKDFNFDKIKEIWTWDSRLTITNYGLPEKQLDIINALKNAEFKADFLELLKVIFSIDNSTSSDETNSLIYFDTYLLTANNMVSGDVEILLLSEIAGALNEFGLTIKRHPGDRNKEKYKALNTPVMSNSYVPWEVLRLLELENSDHDKQYIYLTYGSTALFHERWLFNNYDSHLIFLDKILSQYSDISFSTNDFMTKFIEIYGDKNIYFPLNFTEIREIVCRIKKPAYAEKIDFKVALLDEKDRISKWFIQKYKNSWETIPSKSNITSIMADYGDGYTIVAEIPFSIEKRSDFSFRFILPTDKRKEVKKLMWYSVRGRMAKIKINHISCENNAKEVMIDQSLLRYDGQADQDGFIQTLSYDPCIEILYGGEITSVIIKGEWEFSDSYQSYLELHNKIVERYARIIDEQVKVNNKLMLDISERDKVIREVSDRVIERDNVIKEIADRVIERDNVIKEIADRVIERDNVISQITDNVNAKELQIHQLVEDIKFKDETITRYTDKKILLKLKRWISKKN